jgi:hypothetical protein
MLGCCPRPEDENEETLAPHVGRILRNEKVGELSCRAADYVEMVINLRSTRTLGLEILTILLVRADEVIE